MYNDIQYRSLPKDLFLTRVPVVATYSQDEIDICGFRIESNSEGRTRYDTHKDLTTVMINIDKMIDIYCNGYPVYVVNKEDVRKIYVILEQYLHTLLNNNNRVLNTGPTTDDRLSDIERFAAEMFNINKGNIVRGLVNVNNTGNDPYKLGMDTIDIKAVPANTNECTITMARPDSFDYNQFNSDMFGNNLNNNINYVKKPSNLMFVYDTVPEIDISKITRTPTTQQIHKFNNKGK